MKYPREKLAAVLGIVWAAVAIAQPVAVNEAMGGTMSTTWTAGAAPYVDMEGAVYPARILAPSQIMPDPGVMLMAGKDGSMYPSAISIDWKYLCEHRAWTEQKMREACGR